MVSTLKPPIYAEPGELQPDIVAELARRSRVHVNDPRRVAQHRRHLILQNRHKALIAGRVNEVTKTEIRDEIASHISTALNPAEDIITSVCQVWKRGATRLVDEVSEESNKAFQRLTFETGIDALAPTWNRLAYFVGPLVVLPVMRRGKLRLEAIPPHVADVVLDPYDPLGQPVAVAYQLRDCADFGTGADLCVVDAYSRRYFDLRQGMAVEIEHLREDHGLGRFPGTALRFDVPMEADDWYGAHRHQRLEDGSLDVGRIYATLGFVRRTQNKYLLVAVGQLEALASGQNLGDPERPITGNLPADRSARDDLSFSSLPFDTDPANFQKEIRFTIEAMAESTGVPVTVTSGGDSKHDIEYDYGALTELRNAQIWHARNFELELWSKAVAYAKKAHHPLWSDLPTSEEVDNGFQVEFTRLARKFADPQQERDHMDWLLSKGAARILDVIRDSFPTMSDEQLRLMLHRNLEENGEFYDEVAKRNAVMNPTTNTILDAAQANGAMGPAVRDGKAKQDHD